MFAVEQHARVVAASCSQPPASLDDWMPATRNAKGPRHLDAILEHGDQSI
jgi:hypothetical protein